MVRNNAVLFQEIPTGEVVPGQHLIVKDIGFDETSSVPPQGLIVQTHYLSLDPYQRQRMSSADNDTRNPRFALGQPIDNFGIARVLKSDCYHLVPGDLIEVFLPFSEFAILDAEAAQSAKKLVNPHGVDPGFYLGALGMTGLTAYSSFYAIGKPQKGQTIFITAASGAVGQIVGQLAKREGMKVIGSVGSDAKLRHILDKLKFDGGFNYHTEPADAALTRLAPEGLDVYYDNVGGEQLDAALLRANDFARFVMCGTMSQFNTSGAARYGVQNLSEVVDRRITMRGFIVIDEEFGPRYANEHREKFGEWIQDGSLIVTQAEIKGLERGPEAFASMLSGKLHGKAVLKVVEE